MDGSRTVFSMWGIAETGTYASGVYFDAVFPTINTLTNTWYIAHWQDLNGNSVPDYPTKFAMTASRT